MMIPKTVLALTLITVISITPAFAETMAIEVDGLMKVNHAVSYTSTGIEIESISADLESIALIFQVLVSESESEGDISITFDRAIFDANITTLISAMILFSLGSGPVKGFAVTLGIGILTTLFSAYFFARHLSSIYVMKNKDKEITI